MSYEKEHNEPDLLEQAANSIVLDWALHLAKSDPVDENAIQFPGNQIDMDLLNKTVMERARLVSYQLKYKAQVVGHKDEMQTRHGYARYKSNDRRSYFKSIYPQRAAEQILDYDIAQIIAQKIIREGKAVNDLPLRAADLEVALYLDVREEIRAKVLQISDQLLGVALWKTSTMSEANSKEQNEKQSQSTIRPKEKKEIIFLMQQDYLQILDALFQFKICNKTNFSVRDIQGIERPIPSLESIIHFIEESGIMKILSTFKNPHLYVTPFGMSLSVLARKAFFEAIIPVFNYGDAQKQMAYFPLRFNESLHGGKTKKQLLNDKKNPFPGWLVTILDGKLIPCNKEIESYEDLYFSRGKRFDVKSGEGLFADMEEPVIRERYSNERIVFLTLEELIMLKAVDLLNGTGMGARIPETTELLASYWHSEDNITCVDTDSRGSSIITRGFPCDISPMLAYREGVRLYAP